MPEERGKLGELLLREKLITPLQLQKAIEEQKAKGGRLGYHITKMGFVNEKDYVAFLSKIHGIPSINLSEFEIEPDVRKLIPKDCVIKRRVIPVNRTGQTLIIAMADPSDIFAIDDVRALTGYHIEVVVASDNDIEEAIQKYYTANVDFDEIIADFSEDEIDIAVDEEDIALPDLEKTAGEAPVIKLVNYILIDAIKKGSSDIHIEPYERVLRIRYRIDGLLYEVLKPPLKLKHAIASRIKIMANLDIAERRLPQDGRIKMRLGKDREIDFRVSVIPTLFGEKVVLRILDKSTLQLDMTRLGFDEDSLEEFRKAIRQPYGMLLLTGPTGSGKTTTLYSTLSELNKITTNIVTVEDPVEYHLFGINQVQVHEEIGLNFSSALRSFLRQDPDIIMVGEIRDFETAEIGIKAALTGHLVLSTLHTNDAASSITRLLNMGIEPFLVASSLLLVGAQRLVRKVCPDCKEIQEVSPQVLIDLGVHPDEVDTFTCYKGMGCSSCSSTGYKGRTAIFEIMPISEEIRELILSGASTMELKREAIREGMKTLRHAALLKLRDGITSLDEVVRVTARD